MKKTKNKPDRLYPVTRFTPRTRDLPATQGMLQLVRAELKSDIKELRSELKADVKQVGAKVAQVEAKVAQVDSKVEQLGARVERVLEAVHHVAGEVARVGILVEEQHSRNNLVLEGHTGLAQRQDRMEARIDGVEKLVRSIARARS